MTGCAGPGSAAAPAVARKPGDVRSRYVDTMSSGYAPHVHVHALPVTGSVHPAPCSFYTHSQTRRGLLCQRL